MQRAPCPAGVWGGMYSRQSPRAGGAHPPGGAPTTYKGRSFVSALAAWPQDPSGRGAQTARGVSALEAGLSKQGGVTNDTRVLTENAQACARWSNPTEKGFSGPCTPGAVGEVSGFGEHFSVRCWLLSASLWFRWQEKALNKLARRERQTLVARRARIKLRRLKVCALAPLKPTRFKRGGGAR